MVKGIRLTVDACIRLRNKADNGILTGTLVRVLAKGQGGGDPAFVTDDASYASVELTPELNKTVHVGAAIRILSASRRPDDDTCPVVIERAEIVYAGMVGVDTYGVEGPELDEPPLVVTDMSGETEVTTQQSNQPHTQCARCDVLEHLLADVCRRDLVPGHKGGIMPGLVESLLAIVN